MERGPVRRCSKATGVMRVPNFSDSYAKWSVKSILSFFAIVMKNACLVFLLPLFFLHNRLGSSPQYNDAITFKKPYTY